MQGSTKIPITDINAYITCKICYGYFVDASTIIECLHTFCRSCIIKYLQNNKYCPVCDVQVHKSKPLLNIRPDKTVQDIVYKLVPRLFQNEMRRRREFYDTHPEAKPSSLEQCGEVAYQHLLTPDETICLTLSYHGADNKPRYLRCPAAVTMGHLKKLIRAKYDLSENHRVDILYNQDCLSSSLSLMDVAYIYLWKRKGPIELTYRIYENTAKKLKLEVPDHQELPGLKMTTIVNNNNNNISNNNNWKEVQLRISENGEMSITGIQDAALSPSLLEIVNSEPKYKNDVTVIDSKSIGKQVIANKELPGLKYIGKVNATCTNILNSTTPSIVSSHPLPIDNLTNVYTSINIPTYVNPIPNMTVTSIAMPINDHLTVSHLSPSSSCATLSSGSTTTVFSTINTTKCSTKSEDSLLKIVKSDPIETNLEKTFVKEGEKSLKRKLEPNIEVEPAAKQPKPIILNHIGLLNLSNNHPLKKHSKLNRNGEHVKDIVKVTTEVEVKTLTTVTTSSAPVVSLAEIQKSSGVKKDSEVSKPHIINKSIGNIQGGRPSTPTSKPLAMRAKTLISESGVKPPCYQPRTVYGSLMINVPKPVPSIIPVTSSNIAVKSDSRPPQTVSTKTPTLQKSEKSITTPPASQPSQPSPNVNHKHPSVSTPQSSQPTQNVMNKTTSVSQSQNSNSSTSKVSNINQIQSVVSESNSTNKVPSSNTSQTSHTIQGSSNKSPTSPPQQQHQSSQPNQSNATGTSIKTPVTTVSSPPLTNQSTTNKVSSTTIKSKPSTPIGYKTLRDPPKSWNSQISKANLSKSSPDQKYSDLKNVRPPKFFKMRNNMPRYLGNPASGVKPMYQVHVSPEKEKTPEPKSEKIEIKKHSIVKIDPKTLKPVSEKAPETTSLSNHNSTHPNFTNQNLNSHMPNQVYPNQCLNSNPNIPDNSGLNLQNDLKINTSSVSIFNPLKLQSSPKNERRSPKSPHSPKTKTTGSPTGNKREKINLNFTPPNPFVPNLSSKTLSPNQFIYTGIPPGFPPYDPRVMAAYYSQWYGQRMPFSPAALPGLNLDLNQRKSLEILTSPGSPKMDVLTQSMLNHQIPTRPPSLTSTEISPLPRNHNIPLSTPAIAKSASTSKKSSKEAKSEKSLETVVEKMTQNRNKIINKVHNDSSNPRMKEPEINKMEIQKNSPSIADKSENDASTKESESMSTTVDQKRQLNKVNNVSGKVDSGTNQIVETPSNVPISNNSKKEDTKSEASLTTTSLDNSNSPIILNAAIQPTIKISGSNSFEKTDKPSVEDQNSVQTKEQVGKAEVLNKEERAWEHESTTDKHSEQTEVKEKE